KDVAMRFQQVTATKQADGRRADHEDHARIHPAILLRIGGRNLREAEIEKKRPDVCAHATQTSLSSPSQRRTPPRKALRLSPMRAPGGRRLRILALPPPITTLSATSAAWRRATTSSTAFCHFFFPSRL